jgi:hypothetical protein
MKRFSALLLAAAVTIGSSGLSFASTPADPADGIDALRSEASAAITATQWARFSTHLVDALKADQPALRNAAMRLVIEYSDMVNVRAARFDIVRVYRDGSDAQARRMAVVALGSMNDAWVNDFLRRSLKFEKSETLKKTIRATLADRAVETA